MPKEKRVPFVVLSRESLDAAVADVATLKIRHAEARARMELEVAGVQERYQEEMLGISRELESKEAGVFVFCQQHRKELFADKKSMDFLLATVGFRIDPYSVEKSKKDTWDVIARRLEALPWGAAFVRERDPEVNKNALLAAREVLTPEQLTTAGIRFERDEQFYIDPKSEVTEATKMEAKAA